MRRADFRIGLEFWCGGQRWRCTDIGSRVVVAICLEPHEIVSAEWNGDPPTRREERYVADDPSWFRGPPYAVMEHVFDEYSLPGCALTAEEEDVS